MIIYDDDGVGYNVVPMKVIEDIKQEIKEYVDTRLSFEANHSEILVVEKCLEIIDKHTTEITHCMAIFVNGVEH